MKAVGFKNFRNFEEFPMMPIEGVTFLVGQNNSGKSTFTKACRFLAEELEKCIKSDEMNNLTPRVDFAKTCKAFERALYAGHKGDLEFNVVAGYFNITVKFAAPCDKRPIHNEARLIYISIEDTIDDFVWSYDFSKHTFKWEYSGHFFANMVRYWKLVAKKQWEEETDPFLQAIKEVTSLVPVCEHDSQTQIHRTKEYNALVKKLDSIERNYESLTERCVYEYDESTHFSPFDRDMFCWDLNKGIVEMVCRSSITGTETTYIDSYVQRPFIEHVLKDLKTALNSEMVYCSAHESPLTSYFPMDMNSKDEATLLVQRYYYSEYRMDRHKWICKWMKDLGIGTNFTLELVNSEFLGINVMNMQGFKVPLSDLGRGAVQLFFILMRANLLVGEEKYNPTYEVIAQDSDNHPLAIERLNSKFPDGYKRDCYLKSKIIIFEEPEQNLHPALQSKLADLFADIYQTFGYRVIVETHSEYMIRRTQALIASGEVSFENNPFHVYYFPQGELPYDMGYKENGLFINKFGPGFFDEAGKSQMDIIRRVKEAQHV